jgi:DNA-binding Lrp family transcriptional regulator
MTGPRWTDDDKQTLRALYKTTPTRELARRLGRSMNAIHCRMRIEALKGQRIRFTVEALAKIVELNGQGYSDTEIAGELGSDRHCVTAQRERLGLPSNRSSDRFRARVAANTREQCDKAGVSSLGELRALMLRERAIKAGWPSDLRWRSVQILDLLEQRGPMTREDIAKSIGMPWRGSRHSLKGNDPEGSYLANLIKRRLVVNLGRIVSGRGQGASVSLYSMAIDAQRRKTQ